MNPTLRITSRCHFFALWVCLLLLLAFGIGNTRAESFSGAFESANKLYAEGQYEPAINTYSNLVAKGEVSTALYFNLGNACMKDGRLGLAVVYYQRAADLSPRDPDIRANLQLARSRACQGNPPKNSVLRSWTSWFSLNEWSALASLAWWGWLGLLVAIETRPQWKPRMAKPQRLLMVLVLVTLSGLGLRLYFTLAIHSAMIIVKEVPVKYGPLEESRVFYSLQDGAEVIALERQDQWIQIADNQRRTGWVRSDQVMTVISPTPVLPVK